MFDMFDVLFCLLVHGRIHCYPVGNDLKLFSVGKKNFLFPRATKTNRQLGSIPRQWVRPATKTQVLSTSLEQDTRSAQPELTGPNSVCIE
jgi:hypothetical protein